MKKNPGIRKLCLVLLALCGAGAVSGEGYNSYRHSDSALKTLFVWGTVSTAAGCGMLALDDTHLRWFGIQNCLWGSIDASLAWYLIHRGKQQLQSGVSPETHRIRFRKLLFINGLIDIAYIGTGVALYTLGTSDMMQGNGLGMMVQGGFLFAFDWGHYGLTFRK